ncbi:MAG: ORF6N domain-containing protein [Sulfuricurvum sp.]|nr:ORF6N domain-containing protein [Sulfuricurvum sp.]
MTELTTSIDETIKTKIYTIRGLQVMLDRNLAELYEVETRALKQAVKRNIDRFPNDFMIELSDIEIDFMVSQSVIPSKQYLGGAKPFAFTEQGVSMLSSVLTSKIALNIHIEIMRAFVQMRQVIASNSELFSKIEQIEKRQISYELKSDEKFEKIFSAIEDKSVKPKQGIFYDGQVYDAYIFVSDLIKSANESIVVIDNYIDDTVLTLLSKRELKVKVTIYTKNITKQLELDLQKHNAQYPNIELKKFDSSHDRFLLIDSKEVYHIGASLKDLGKKWFAFSKFDVGALDILGRLK